MVREINKKIEEHLRKNGWVYLSLFFMFTSCYLLSYTFMDNDGWFILANGKYIVEHGVPRINPFTMIEGLGVILQQWLYSVMSYKVYEVGGYPGVYLMCLLFYAACLFIYIEIGKLYGVKRGTSLVVGSFFFLIGYKFLSIRPTFITIMLCLWQIYVLEKYKRDGKSWKLLQLILISLIEINVHAAIWPFHFVLLLPYIVPPIKNPFVTFKKKKYNKCSIVGIIPAMIIAGFVNPYKLDGIKYVFLSYGKELNDIGITELAAPSVKNGSLFFFILVLFTVWWIGRKREVDVNLFYLLCGTMLMGFVHQRNIIYFLFGLMIFLCDNIKPKKSHIVGLVSILLLMVGVCLFLPGMKIFDYQVKDNVYSNVSAVEYLDKHADKDIKLYTNFNNGAFFEWNGYKCFVDPRPELYFKQLNKKQDLFKEYKRISDITGKKYYQEFLDKYEFDYMCVSRAEPIGLYLEMSEEYKPVVVKDSYILYERN